MRAKLAAEREPPVRISLVLAITQLAVEQGDDSGIVAWTRQLWTGQDTPADLQLAGALAWLCATQASPPAALLDLLAVLAGHRRHSGCRTCRGPMTSAIRAAWRRGW